MMHLSVCPPRMLGIFMYFPVVWTFWEPMLSPLLDSSLFVKSHLNMSFCTIKRCLLRGFPVWFPPPRAGVGARPQHGQWRGVTWRGGERSSGGVIFRWGNPLGVHQRYPLVMTVTVSYWKLPIEIVDLPIDSMVIFHRFLLTFTRGPEGTFFRNKWEDMGKKMGLHSYKNGTGIASMTNVANWKLTLL